MSSNIALAAALSRLWGTVGMLREQQTTVGKEKRLYI